MNSAKITLSMIMRNEADRYLPRCLETNKRFIDACVIVDDNSTDDTVKICEAILKDIPHTIIKNEESLFGNEVSLRKKQWQETIKTNPDWILNLDADEELDDEFMELKKQLKDASFDAVYLRLFDMWSPQHYREDGWWRAHHVYGRFYSNMQMLKEFSNGKAVIVESNDKSFYATNEMTHYWKDALILKVAAMKDAILNYARDQDFDYVFLVDSDLVLHPKCLGVLMEAEKDIISNIFWTSWSPGTMEMPQVWLQDEYSMFYGNPSDEEKNRQTYAFMEKLRQPGVYEVGGLGACTLISRHALQKGVSFKRIHNLSFWGEDRHFCVRAVALGLSLFVDTHYPAFHVYRESDLERLPDKK